MEYLPQPPLLLRGKLSQLESNDLLHSQPRLLLLLSDTSNQPLLQFSQPMPKLLLLLNNISSQLLLLLLLAKLLPRTTSRHRHQSIRTTSPREHMPTPHQPTLPKLKESPSAMRLTLENKFERSPSWCLNTLPSYLTDTVKLFNANVDVRHK